MAEEPRKRPRIEQNDAYYRKDYNDIAYDERTQEIIDLKKKNQALLEENAKLNAYISKFTSGWAKVSDN
jgi:cell division protein FtsB